MNLESITIKTVVSAPINKVWDCWNGVEHITKWAFASDDWEALGVSNDVRVGGKFKTVMSAKDKSASFDFTGKYTNVIFQKILEYDMDDKRHVKIIFNDLGDKVEIIETFDPESENSLEMQKDGWQAILDNFKKYAEHTSI